MTPAAQRLADLQTEREALRQTLAEVPAIAAIIDDDLGIVIKSLTTSKPRAVCTQARRGVQQLVGLLMPLLDDYARRLEAAIAAHATEAGDDA